MSIRTPAEGRATSPNSGIGTVTELSGEPTPPSKNSVMSSPLTKLSRKRIRWPTATPTPVPFAQPKGRLSPPVVDGVSVQITLGDNPLLSVIANSIPNVVLAPTNERSSEADHSPAGMLSEEVAKSVKKQATDPDVNEMFVPPPVP